MPQVYNDPNEMRGYGPGHWIGCDCDRCRAIRAEHTRRFGTGCKCPVCKWWRNRDNQRARERAQAMSTVNVCDRCETLVKAAALGALTIETSPISGRTDKEICPGCVEEFLEWYDGSHGNRPKAYSRPYEPPKSETDPAEAFAARVAEHLRGDSKALPAGTQDRPRTVTHNDESVWLDDNAD